MKIKRLLAIILAVSLIGGSFAGCTGGTGGTSSTSGGNSSAPASDELPETLENPNISIVYWYNQDQYEQDKAADENIYDPILEAIPDFEAKYGGKVDVIYAEWGKMLEEATNRQNAGEAPDLIEVYDRIMHNVIFTDMVQPIDDYVTDADFSYYKVDRSLFSWKDKTYAIPIKPYLKYIMFNKDLFDLEGLTHPDDLFREGKWNWEEFEKAGKALLQRKDGEISQKGLAGWGEIITQFMVANVSGIINVDTKNGTVTSALKTPAVQNTITKFSDWLSEPNGFVHIDDNGSMWGWWDNGALGMICGKEFPNTNPFDVGMAPLPTGSDLKGKNVYVYPQAFAMPAGSKNPKGAAVFMRMVNDKQKEVGDAKEAARYGQENYDMIYADDVNYVYAYDKATKNIDTIVASIINYAADKTPAATIAETLEPELNSDIELIYSGQ